jgi:hypothetical protein
MNDSNHQTSANTGKASTSIYPELSDGKGRRSRSAAVDRPNQLRPASKWAIVTAVTTMTQPKSFIVSYGLPLGDRKRVGGAGRDRPKSRSAAGDRPTRGETPKAARL